VAKVWKQVVVSIRIFHEKEIKAFAYFSMKLPSIENSKNNSYKCLNHTNLWVTRRLIKPLRSRMRSRDMKSALSLLSLLRRSQAVNYFYVLSSGWRIFCTNVASQYLLCHQILLFLAIFAMMTSMLSSHQLLVYFISCNLQHYLKRYCLIHTRLTR